MLHTHAHAHTPHTHTRTHTHYLCTFYAVYFVCLLQACAKEGAQVIATDVNAEKLAELQGTEGVSVLFISLSTKSFECRQLTGRNLAKFNKHIMQLLYKHLIPAKPRTGCMR